MIRLPIYYLIAVSGMYFLQDYFIYYPGKTDAKLIEKEAKNRGLGVWPDSVESYRGFLAPPAAQKARGTIIVFHGNAGAALDRSYYVHALGRLGYRGSPVAPVTGGAGPGVKRPCGFQPGR